MLINNLSNITTSLIQSSLFNNDITLINKIQITYKSILKTYNSHLFGTNIHMGDLYLLAILGIFAPLIGKTIGDFINSKNSQY